MGKKSNKQPPNEASLYMRKKERDKMGDLSLIAFGSRGKWRKLANKHGLTIDGMRLQMEAIVSYMTGGKNVKKEETKDNSSND